MREILEKWYLRNSETVKIVLAVTCAVLAMFLAAYFGVDKNREMLSLWKSCSLSIDSEISAQKDNQP